MPNFNPKTKFTFPEESSAIILGVLEKQGLRETDEEFYEKWEKSEKTQEGILADLVIKIAEGLISAPESVSLVQKELRVSPRKAQQIIDDLTKKIITPATQISKEIPTIGEILLIE